MADGEGNTPRKARQDDRNSGKDRSAHRHSEENPSNGRPSHDQSPPVTSQTQVMSVPHNGAQSHPPMDVDITQGNVNGQTVQSYGNSEAGDQQQATGSYVNVVDNKGPTQLGERSTIIYNIYNPTYNNYYGSHQPPHHQSNTPYHDPTHCPPCLNYHHNDHQPLPEHTRQHQEAQRRDLLPSPNHVPQLLPSGQREQPAARQTEQYETNTQRGRVTSRSETQSHVLHPATQTVGQSVKKSGQSVSGSVGDVRANVTNAEKRAKKSAEPAVACNEVPKPQTPQGVSRLPETRQVSDDEVVDNLTIFDTKGRRLMPGDVVDCSRGLAIYTGNQRIVWCEGPGEVVKSETLNMTQPLQKIRIISVGECSVFPAQERVERSMSRVGTPFTETDGRLLWGCGSDFTFWVATGLGYFQAWIRGFRLERY